MEQWPPYCKESKLTFKPKSLLETWCYKSPDIIRAKTFEICIRSAFWLHSSDSYVYHASGSTTLHQAQVAINAKGRAGLHAWYKTDEDIIVDPPPKTDIEAYTSLFAPSASLESALNVFHHEAKKDSLRSHIGAYLRMKFYVDPAAKQLLPNKKARELEHTNPYFDMWKYSCEELEWVGPWPNTTNTKFSHHMLPIFYHHFGCVCPSFQALWVIANLAQPSAPTKNKLVKPIFDVGSGNGYWTYMLRNLYIREDMKPLQVYPVDDGSSEYRTVWIEDTVNVNGVEFIQQQNRTDAVLLLVYPIVSGSFTSSVLKAFKGDTIVVAGTQNGNGFTGFADQAIDEWIAGNMPEWALVMRLPLPSFAGKDDALYVFRRNLGGVATNSSGNA
ncbi:hypothetical protein GQ43DRAFT_370194 [Delitschia confertaspora ATCC 74209]|uniref:Uncharacterized protein n=1 Tax=Delitschia confertaspora ATCC 74209 TaxID=1513339 RepID=A0A9P4JMT6_9PLEO|nr:hypothetical protein GQ43DRAFT_370194 [Delitschia confertaspora ATCC 74209]